MLLKRVQDKALELHVKTTIQKKITEYFNDK